ncbi:MAG: tetratricopeptide repeat protein [Acidobacteria bacterium]|jgi:tetratricopeptide (TPR) repeat protein|nr:tetratricopeptide repeat protein [Acidobacteriota bacterium]
MSKRRSSAATEGSPQPVPAAPPSLSPPFPSGKALLAIAALAFFAYLMLPPKPIISDAVRAVTLNPVVQEKPLSAVFSSDFWGAPADASYGTRSYRPLVALTYAIEARALGNAPQVYHVTDMLLHAGTAVLVTLLAALLLAGSPWALAAGALFAVHPVATEAVASIVGRADIMAAAALLGALILHLLAGSRASPWAWEAGALALLGAGLLCKEYAVAFPFILAACDLAFRACGRSSRADERRQPVVLGLALGLLVGYLALRYALIGALGGVPMLGDGDQPLYDQPLGVRLATALWLVVVSARFMVLPVAHDYFYGAGTIAIVKGFLEPRALAGIVLIGLLVAWAVRSIARRMDPVPALAVALFLLPLAPSLNTVSVAGVLYAERFLYLPLAGFALGVGWLLTRYATGPAGERAGRIAMAGALLVCLVLTMNRVGDWRSQEALARASLRWYPENSRAWYEVGLAHGQRAQELEAKGQAEAARAEHTAAAEAIRRSLAVENRAAQIWRALALAEKRLGRYGESVKAYREAIRNAPTEIGMLYAGLGEAELEDGQFEAAVRSLARAHELMPREPGIAALQARAQVRLAQKRLLEGHAEEAVDLAQRGLDSGALSAEGTWTAGEVFARAGHPESAAAAFRQAAARDPNVLRSRFGAAMQLDQAGKHEEAAAAFAALLVADPDHVPTLFNLARSLVLLQRPAEAVPLLERGLALKEDERARALLADARRQAAR